MVSKARSQSLCIRMVLEECDGPDELLSDVKVSNGLSVMHIWVEGKVTQEDAVEVNISVKEDISPQYVRESRAVN